MDGHLDLTEIWCEATSSTHTGLTKSTRDIALIADGCLIASDRRNREEGNTLGNVFSDSDRECHG